MTAKEYEVRWNAICSVDGCHQRRRRGRALCVLHWWETYGDPTGGRLVREGDVLPNPWVDVAPSCSEGHEPAEVYLWHPKPEDGLGRWFCSPCGKRFTPQRPPHRIPTGGP